MVAITLMLGGGVAAVIIRPDRPDDLKSFKPYVAKDVTVYFRSSGSGNPRRQRTLYLHNISSELASELANHVVEKRGWSMGRSSPNLMGFPTESDPLNPRFCVQGLTPSYEVGHPITVVDSVDLSFWEVVQVRIKYLGQDPFKN